MSPFRDLYIYLSLSGSFKVLKSSVVIGIFSSFWVTEGPGIFSHIFLILTQTKEQTDRHLRWPVNNVDGDVL